MVTYTTMVLIPPRGVRDEIVLEDKLEEARLQSVKRRKQITIGLFATLSLWSRGDWPLLFRFFYE